MKNGKKRSLVAIIDYGMGNLFSVEQACKRVGFETVYANNPMIIEEADAVILPGVGAFGNAMENLRAMDMVEAIRKAAESKPLIGICLGMQLLMTESEEFGSHQGLDLIPGCVKRFENLSGDGNQLKIPHIGWNYLHASSAPTNSTECSGLRRVWAGDDKQNECFYFVHSYYVQPSDKNTIVRHASYGACQFPAVLVSGNIIAFQFHPEKSGVHGLKIYHRLAEYIHLNF